MKLREIKDLESVDITKLEPGKHTYLVQVNIEDMPRIEVGKHLMALKQLFLDRGISNIIFVAVGKDAAGKITIKELVNDN